MSWLGAGFGASIGFAIGGPIGAGIGLWLGSKVGNRDGNVTLAQESQTLFFVSLFSMLAKMSKADGIVVQSEIDAITSFMERLKLDGEDKQAAINICRNAKDDKYTIYDYAKQYRGIANQEMQMMLYSALWAVAYSDGNIHESEKEILKKIPYHLGLEIGIYDKFYNQILGCNESINNIGAHYEILGANINNTDDEIKKCYKSTIAKFHPDKIQSKGLPKEFISLANEQTKKINKAYDVIKKSRRVNS